MSDDTFEGGPGDEESARPDLERSWTAYANQCVDPDTARWTDDDQDKGHDDDADDRYGLVVLSPFFVSGCGMGAGGVETYSEEATRPHISPYG